MLMRYIVRTIPGGSLIKMVLLCLKIKALDDWIIMRYNNTVKRKRFTTPF